MSYYDRLGSVLAREGAISGDTKELETTQTHDSQVEGAEQDKDTALQNKEQLKIGEIGAGVGLKKLALDPLLKAGGWVDKKAGQAFMKSTASGTESGDASFVGKVGTKIQSWAGAKQSSFVANKANRLQSAMEDRADLMEKGAGRLASGLDPAGSAGSAGISGARASATLNVANQNRNITQLSVRGVAGKVAEGGLDMLPGIGEFAMLGGALGEAIHKAHQIHKEQDTAQGIGKLAGQASVQAGQYVGNNRPSFGSMALPSFDTSHVSSALTE